MHFLRLELQLLVGDKVHTGIGTGTGTGAGTDNANDNNSNNKSEGEADEPKVVGKEGMAAAKAAIAATEAVTNWMWQLNQKISSNNHSI